MSIQSLKSNAIRFSGMNSGLDTEAIVDAMSAATKNAINTKDRQIQKIQWKQEAYRSIISKMSSFQSKYFDILNRSTYLGSSGAFQKYKTTSSSATVTASAGSSALAGTYTLEVNRIATAQTIRTAQGTQLTKDVAIELNGDHDADQAYKMKVAVGSTTKELAFTVAAGEDPYASLQHALDEAFNLTGVDVGGSPVYNTSVTVDANGVIKASGGRTLSISKVDAGGDWKITGASSNRINLSTKLSEVSLETPLSGNIYEFTINGQSFSFSGDDSLSTVMSRINNSDAKVQMTYSPADDSFTLSAKDLGAGQNIIVEQTTGNLLSSILGVKAGEKIGSRFVNTASVTADHLAGSAKDAFDVSRFSGDSMKLKIGDEEAMITLKNRYTSYSEMVSDVNKQIKKITGDSSVRLTMNTTADAGIYFTLDSDNHHAVTLENGEGSSVLSKLGFSGSSVTNVRTPSELLDKELPDTGITVRINGTEMKLLPGKSMAQLIADSGVPGASYDPLTGVLTGVESFSADTPDGEKFLTALFGRASYTGPDPIPTQKITYGTDASYTINGQAVETNSNMVTYNGLSIQLSSQAVDAGVITVDVMRDLEPVKDLLLNFVKDYNEVISALSTPLTESPPKKGGRREVYDPLVDDEKIELSETEVEKWEKLAKQGLLYGDKNLSGALSSLRTALMTSVEGFSLANLGITTTSKYEEYGKLAEIDEATLLANLDKYADKVVALFTDLDHGVAAKLKEAVESAVATRGDLKGSLVRQAGVIGTTTVNDNFYARQIESLQDALERLEGRYQTEQERYWAKFSNLETIMGKLNSQQSYIASMLGNG